MIDLAKLRVGMTRQEVVEAIGEPEDTGGTSRKYKTPSCYKYGEIQLFFQPWKNGGLAHGSLYGDDGLYVRKIFG
jgi:hypothetical protein